MIMACSAGSWVLWAAAWVRSGAKRRVSVLTAASFRLRSARSTLGWEPGRRRRSRVPAAGTASAVSVTSVAVGV